MNYQLIRTQQLSCDIDQAWNFFSSPHNLATITPKEMKFIVTSQLQEGPIYEGMIIDYKISPLLGVKMGWTTKITQVDAGTSFTDFQQKGPYKLWNHFHEFIPNEQGVLIRDTVDYALPFGIFGKIAHALFVRKKLESIFKYRHQILEKMFNNK